MEKLADIKDDAVDAVQDTGENLNEQLNEPLDRPNEIDEMKKMEKEILFNGRY